MKPCKLWVFALLLSLAGFACAGETGTALKNDTIRKEPFSDAKTAGTLNRGDKVEILAKKGAWLQVKSRGTAGWVRLLSVKRGVSGKSDETAGVLGLASGRAGTGKVVATTGVRGLSEEELKTAKFDENEVHKLESYAVSSSQAKKFANAGGLKAIKLAHLPEPKPAKEQP